MNLFVHIYLPDVYNLLYDSINHKTWSEIELRNKSNWKPSHYNIIDDIISQYYYYYY